MSPGRGKVSAKSGRGDAGGSRDVVKAAGGVVTRRTGKKADQVVEVLLVHRPRYDDWSFPKGKLDPGETHKAAALREVQEETGLSCRLGSELASASYSDGHGRPKIVRYWEMIPVGGSFEPNDEVDQVRWMSLGQAAKRLSYAHDVDVLESFTQMSPDQKA